MSITEIFGKARAEGRAVLVGCMPAGFPTVDDSIASMIAMHEAGCDVIEVELPYSDPVMDGPVIQKASDIALAAGVRTRDTLHIIEQVAKAGASVVLMTYWNPIEKYGVHAFARDLAAAGATGMITPDLIPDEAQEWIAASDEHHIDRTFLVSPSSTDERIAMLPGGHTSKRIDDAVLRGRKLDALVLLAYAPHDELAREVERRASLTPTAEAMDVVAHLPLAGGTQRYLVLRPKP